MLFLFMFFQVIHLTINFKEHHFKENLLHRGQIQKLSEGELREIEADRHRRVKEMRLRREIQEKTFSHETPRETPEEKKKKFR